jgi:hypothetical protein
VVFQSFVFGQILAVLDSFGQIWAEFPAFTMAESMPELGLKSSKPHIFLTVQMLHATACWKATIHIYSFKKFFKIQKSIACIVAYPRMQKPISVNNVF